MYKILYFPSGTLQKSHPEQNTHVFCLLPSDMLLCIYMRNGSDNCSNTFERTGQSLEWFFLAMEYQNLER